MKTGRKHIILALLLIGAIAMLAPQTVMAAGTAAGTTITNSATVDFYVSGVHQPAPAAATTNFKVDDKVSFTFVSQDNANVTIAPSGAAYQTYVLTNTGNGPHDFTIDPAVIGGNTLAPFSGPTLYSTNTGTGGTQLPIAATVNLPYIGNLASDATTTVYMYIVAPTSPVDASFANYNVTAEAYEATTLAGGTHVLSSAQALAAESVDKNANLNNQYVVLNDGVGTGTGDISRDGKFAATAKNGGVTVGFLVASANIIIGKTAVIYDDPINGVYNAVTNVKPKAIPLAHMIYTLTVTNSGSAGTTSLSVSDTLPTIAGNPALSFVTYPGCAAGDAFINGSCSAAGVTYAGQTLTITGLSAGALGSGTNVVTVKYMVIIN
jgi:hypothetical protein